MNDTQNNLELSAETRLPHINKGILAISGSYPRKHRANTRSSDFSGRGTGSEGTQKGEINPLEKEMTKGHEGRSRA